VYEGYPVGSVLDTRNSNGTTYALIYFFKVLTVQTASFIRAVRLLSSAAGCD